MFLLKKFKVCDDHFMVSKPIKLVAGCTLLADQIKTCQLSVVALDKH
jgi:hypothetical protein